MKEIDYTNDVGHKQLKCRGWRCGGTYSTVTALKVHRQDEGFADLLESHWLPLSTS